MENIDYSCMHPNAPIYTPYKEPDFTSEQDKIENYGSINEYRNRKEISDNIEDYGSMNEYKHRYEK